MLTQKLHLFKDKAPVIGRWLSLVLLAVTIIVVVTSFIRSRRQPRPPGPVRAESALKANVTSIVEGYRYVGNRDGRETFRLLAARDVAYEDGRHEMEQVDLTAYGDQPGKSIHILAEKGLWDQPQSIVTFTGRVKVASSEGLEVTTETLRYEQLNELAATDQPVQFRRADISGSSVGALLYAKTKNLALLKNAVLISANPDPNNKGGLPVEIRSESANYSEPDGVARFTGNCTVVQGEKSAKADAIAIVIDPKTKKLVRVEMRGNSQLSAQEKEKISEMQSRDMDFHFDESQHLNLIVALGSARAKSLEQNAPREIAAEKIEAVYQPGKPGDKSNSLKSVTTQGRTTMKIVVPDGGPDSKTVSERVIEADSVQTSFRDDGKYISRAEASGNAILTVTPKPISGTAEKKILKAPGFIADFQDSGNAIKTFIADGGAIAEIEAMQQDAARPRKTLRGKKLTASFNQQTQDVAEMIVDGDAKFTEGERNATASKAVYNASSRIVALRGKPLLWDSSARTNADEIDANLDSGESLMRGRVRTTYYSRETTGGAAPFKNRKAPVTIASDRAIVRHREGAAKYQGNVRAWQDDDFIRADIIELDKGERSMTASNNVQSAYYNFERKVEKGRKEIIPVFAGADRMTYTDANRTAVYDGSVRIRQGTDTIESLSAVAKMDEDNKLVGITASKNVVMTQPNRRATGDQLIYTVADDTAVLTGDLATAEDLDKQAVTKSAKLTLHLADARIEANDDSGNKKRVKTTHRIHD